MMDLGCQQGAELYTIGTYIQNFVACDLYFGESRSRSPETHEVVSHPWDVRY